MRSWRRIDRTILSRLITGAVILGALALYGQLFSCGRETVIGECNVSGECQYGYLCRNHACIQTCNVDSDCVLRREVCREGICGPASEACIPETEIPCNGIDEDCDGYDGKISGILTDCTACGDDCSTAAHVWCYTE